MASKFFILGFFLILAMVSCKAEKPVEQKKSAPPVIAKSRPVALSEEQRTELGFPSRIIAQVEVAAGVKAEPFFATVVMRSENLKGDKGFESKKLAGFSIHTTKADDIMEKFRASFRSRGYLIFRSHRGYGALPDIVTVIKGNNSYDILKVQGTEGINYNLDTKAIITWLKAHQRDASFMIIGAGPDWLEARFIKPPRNMRAFAKKVSAFAPDVLTRDTRSVEKLSESMQKTNGFNLAWE
jgi:hypothetical protein